MPTELPGGLGCRPLSAGPQKKPLRGKSQNGEKPTIGNQTEPATDLPHFAILVYVIKPKAGFVGDHNIIRDTLVHIVVDWDCEEVLDKSVCCPVLLAVTKT